AGSADMAAAAASTAMSVRRSMGSSSWFPWMLSRTRELHRRADERLGLVAVGRVAAAGQLQQPRVRDLAGDAADLRHGPVFIVDPLHCQQRRADRSDLALDGPVAKRRMQ